MFCFQCQETMKNTGCTKIGVCGKKEDVANLQDLLIYATKELALATQEKKVDSAHIIYDNLFRTITNANFDSNNLRDQILVTINKIKEIGSDNVDKKLYDLDSMEDMLKKASVVGVLAETDEDVRSLKEMTMYGLKGLAAYGMHAYVLGYRSLDIENFVLEALIKVRSKEKDLDELLALVIKTGEYGVKVMALLDEANTKVYGVPEMTKVNIGVRNKPAILVSGHDLKDLEQLLEQTKGTGVDVYTHGEMLPAHSYPFFKKYDNLVGNYGNAWWKQISEFKSFNGPILFTTNCIVPRKDGIEKKIFTTGSAAYPGSTHILEDEDGNKDFSEVIEVAKKSAAPEEIENGTIIGGFAHSQILEYAGVIKEAIENGSIKKFIVMGGCDGRHKGRNYYTEFAEKLPKDTIILTSGCAKYRYNKLNLGDIGGIPRVLDAGQCNDSYSLAYVALKLKELFGLDDINDLPIVYNIAWYEQKAVIVLLALLSLGVKNIHLGPSLPGFVSPNVANILIKNFGLSPIGDVDADIAKLI